ncbi:MAG: hypothetical protein ACO3QV_06920, partial [Candidatus Nanopelagicaceae bacterium]
EDKKQKIVILKRLNESIKLIEEGSIDQSPLASAYHRNKTLIDFNSIPDDKRQDILDTFMFAEHEATRADFFPSLLSYLRKHSLNRILEEMDGRSQLPL